jgi:hypothetical protein
VTEIRIETQKAETFTIETFSRRRAVWYSNIYPAFHIPVPEHICSEVEKVDSFQLGFRPNVFGVVFLLTYHWITYSVIKNDCPGFNNLSYTIHLR